MIVLIRLYSSYTAVLFVVPHPEAGSMSLAVVDRGVISKYLRASVQPVDFRLQFFIFLKGFSISIFLSLTV